MLSKAFLLFLVFFCSTVFSLNCYSGDRKFLNGELVKDKPIKAYTCNEKVKFCYKGNVQGSEDDEGVKKKMFAASAGCEEDDICESNGCGKKKGMLPSGYGEGRVCCCTGDLCFAKDDVEKFIKEKSSRRPLLFISLFVLLL